MAKVRTRKRGKTWSYIFEAGHKEDGKRRVIEKGGFPTQEAAYDAGINAYTDWRHGNIGVTSERITVNSFIENWLNNVVAYEVKTSTREMYNIIFHNRIEPYFADVILQDLTSALLDVWMRSLSKKGLARSTLKLTKTILHLALDYAVYPAELISSNPCSYIKVPRSAPANVVKRTIISFEQITELLEKYPLGAPLHIPLLLLYHTGMRRGEVAGLTWDQVDFDNKIINVHSQIVYLRTRRAYFLSSLKTKSSYRFLVMDDGLLKELKRWKEMQEENEQKMGDAYVCVYGGPIEGEERKELLQASKRISIEPGWERISLVCTHPDGKFVASYYISRHLGMEGLNPHSFRHTHATQLIESGAQPKGVAGRLGHKDTTITQNLYTHNTEKLQRDTATIFEETLQTRNGCRQNADKKE